MTCTRFRTDAEAFLAGELNESQAVEMRRHAASCTSCDEHRRMTEVLVALIRKVGVQRMPASVEAAIRARIYTETHLTESPHSADLRGGLTRHLARD